MAAALGASIVGASPTAALIARNRSGPSGLQPADLKKLLLAIALAVTLPTAAFANPKTAAPKADAPKAEVVSKDIVDTAVADPRFSTLVEAVKAAGLVETLKGKGPFTVFAPTNDAFAKIVTDVKTSNGVIHAIDTVMLRQSVASRPARAQIGSNDGSAAPARACAPVAR